ncbi:FecR family protein [Pedobacter sp. AJM]|uniref:FecR family protein n=1 Tax=Pedobacter sp. AJM TaxID=2003629 RepID=UPI000B4AD6EA|nr:FecR domain-containing protein [Pedobacter sp. AJM]OWK70842.1 hypothetical protein CBW18_07015 [Pedobacter sp. AJM]
MSVDHHLLEKYWAGLCNPVERKIVEQWMLDGSPEKPYELRSSEEELKIKEQLWQRIAGAHPEVKGYDEPDKVIRMPVWYKRISIAAIFILLAGLGLYLSNKQSPAGASFTYREVMLPYGKKARITLADGTLVYLNAGSRLKYPDHFSKTERRVFLKGEAFFEVTKNPDKPFYVQTQHTTTRVLGTRFNLQSWEGSFDQLAVEEGRVQLTAAGCMDTLILYPNMQGTFNGHSLKQTTINSAHIVAWTKGIMIFNDRKLSEVAAELERWYGVKVHLHDPALLHYRVKARFDNPSLTDVLQDISFALNIKYNIKDKEVTLSR